MSNGQRAEWEQKIMDKAALRICREAFAARMLAKAGISRDDAVMRAFAAVPRERFLGPPPWKIQQWEGYVDIPSRDPAILYQDLLFALQEERQVNNGSPSLHARGLHKLALREGEAVCHIGAGTGYYTAMLSLIVGSTGRVVAVEFDRELARRARLNLQDYPNVEVVRGNGLEWPKEDTDAIYVNFALHRPAEAWIERLKPGGRLIFPLGTPGRDERGRSTGLTSRAGFFLFRREGDGYGVEFLGPVGFVWGEAVGGSIETYRSLDAAFKKGGLNRIRKLRWKIAPAGDEWYSDLDWGLIAEGDG
jgi:protein-L-isoaspartate(D-aspartate) O-methyltransferase